jgi:hypothetical protein
MNVIDVLDPESHYPILSTTTWVDMFRRRELTFLGFCKTEDRKGLIIPGTPISSSRGQEMARILLFRCIEELVESHDAKEREHRLEELIDAINYFMSFLQFALPDKVETFSQTAFEMCQMVHRQITSNRIAVPAIFSATAVGNATIWVANLGDILRNRAWMENTQHLYFEGEKAMIESWVRLLNVVFPLFGTWGEFWRYWDAKDQVLQFRLNTGY